MILTAFESAEEDTRPTDDCPFSVPDCPVCARILAEAVDEGIRRGLVQIGIEPKQCVAVLTEDAHGLEVWGQGLEEGRAIGDASAGDITAESGE